MLIGDTLVRINRQNSTEENTIKVLDMACGKGGDIKKWIQGKIKYIVFAGITNKERYLF